MLAAPQLKISNHAVRQYRARVLGCPERSRPDSILRPVMARQLRDGKWQCAGGETFEILCGAELPKRRNPGEMKVVSVVYRYIIECQTVVTVLGFMMRPDHRRIQRRRRRRRIAKLAFQGEDENNV